MATLETERVRLRVATTGEGAHQVLSLREPNGRDELDVTGVDTRAALRLLDRLLKTAARPGPANAAELCASDRDALLAALYRLCWGDRILSTLTCVRCGQRFDLSFQLSAVQRHLYAAPGETGRWRPPLGEDELDCCENTGVSEGALTLAHRCGASLAEVEAAAAHLETIAPILDLDLDARCPECGQEQMAHFDLQSFLLQRFLSERETLLDEVHLLAQGYGWSLGEILGLGRSARRGLVRRIMDGRPR